MRLQVLARDPWRALISNTARNHILIRLLQWCARGQARLMPASSAPDARAGIDRTAGLNPVGAAVLFGREPPLELRCRFEKSRHSVSHVSCVIAHLIGGNHVSRNCAGSKGTDMRKNCPATEAAHQSRPRTCGEADVKLCDEITSCLTRS